MRRDDTMLPPVTLDTPQLKATGNYLEFYWPQINLKAIVSNTEEHRGRVLGEVTFGSIQDGNDILMVGPQAVNFLTSQGKKSLKETLVRYYPDLGVKEDLDQVSRLDQVVDRLAFFTQKKLREGSPVEDLAYCEDLPPIRWQLEGLLAQDVTTVFFGDGDTGKSFIALGLAQVMQSGHHLNMGFTPTKTNVLYLDYETSFFDQQRRSSMIQKGFGFPQGGPIKYRHCHQSIPGDINTLHRIVQTNDIGYVIVDSLAGAAGAPLTEEPSISAVFSALRTLDVGALVISHVSKGEPGKPFGSVFIRNWSRSVFDLRRPAGQDANRFSVIVSHDKNNLGPKIDRFGFQLDFTGQDMVRISKTNNSDVRQLMPTNVDRLTETLLEEGRMTTDALSDKTGIPRATIETTLRQRGGDRFIRHKPDGTWGVRAQTVDV